MSTDTNADTNATRPALPPIVEASAWEKELAALRVREKAATRELDAIAAQRRRLPMVEMPDYVLEGEQGPVRLAGTPTAVAPSSSATCSR
jgi:predicted dithiol-disulfide oxidoreductase (DUF899 family)